MTGDDIRARLGFDYTRLDEGKRLLAARGFADLGDLAASVMPEVPVREAAVGDIAVLQAEDDLALGILGGPQIHVLTLSGPSAVSLCQATRVFRP